MEPQIHGAVQWVDLIVRVIDADRDPRTVDDWAALCNTAPNTLRHRCQLVGLNAKQSLDLARSLRALVQSSRLGCPIERLYDVGDPRTLARLLKRARLAPGTGPRRCRQSDSSITRHSCTILSVWSS
jgi:hypothetical protein